MQWLKSQGMYYANKNSVPVDRGSITHTSMLAGEFGVFAVCPFRMKEVWERTAEDYTKGAFHCVSETVDSSLFTMFMDLDVRADPKLVDDPGEFDRWIRALVQVVSDAVCAHADPCGLGEGPLRLESLGLIPTTSPADSIGHGVVRRALPVGMPEGFEDPAIPGTSVACVSDASGMRGVHMVWPGLYVDRPTALEIFDACLASAKETFGDRLPAGVSFETMFDRSPLDKDRVCLRTVGSVNAKGENAYVPWIVTSPVGDSMVSRDVSGESWSKDLVGWMGFLSIHPPTGATLTIRSATERVGNGASGRLSYAERPMDLVRELYDSLRKQFLKSSSLGEDQIKEPMVYVDGRSATFVFQTASRWCPNVGREHSSNHVYIVVSTGSRGVTMRCHSEKRNVHYAWCEVCKGHDMNVGEKSDALKRAMEFEIGRRKGDRTT